MQIWGLYLFPAHKDSEINNKRSFNYHDSLFKIMISVLIITVQSYHDHNQRLQHTLHPTHLKLKVLELKFMGARIE